MFFACMWVGVKNEHKSISLIKLNIHLTKLKINSYKESLYFFSESLSQRHRICIIFCLVVFLYTHYQKSIQLVLFSSPWCIISKSPHWEKLLYRSLCQHTNCKDPCIEITFLQWTDISREVLTRTSRSHLDPPRVRLCFVTVSFRVDRQHNS